METNNSDIQFTLLYDGLCPICQQEIAWLSRFNKRGHLALQDINHSEFYAETYNKTHAELMAEIHGIMPDGTLIKGVPVFRAAYAAVGLGWLMAPTAWPVFSNVFAMLYRLFAKYRLRMGSWFGGPRCLEDTCAINKRP